MASQYPAYCSLMKCHFQSVLIGVKDRNELIGKLDRLCCNYQHVDCFYNLLKYRFSGNISEKNGEICYSVERAVSFNIFNKKVDKIPSILKKRLLREKILEALAHFDSKVGCSSNK